MEISEIVKTLRDKAAELQKFFKITDRPNVIYADSFQFARALEAAADLLEEEPQLVQSRVVERPFEGFVHQVLIECRYPGYVDVLRSIEDEKEGRK